MRFMNYCFATREIQQTTTMSADDIDVSSTRLASPSLAEGSSNHHNHSKRSNKIVPSRRRQHYPSNFECTELEDFIKSSIEWRACLIKRDDSVELLDVEVILVSEWSQYMLPEDNPRVLIKVLPKRESHPKGIPLAERCDDDQCAQLLVFARTKSPSSGAAMADSGKQIPKITTVRIAPETSHKSIRIANNSERINDDDDDNNNNNNAYAVILKTFISPNVSTTTAFEYLESNDDETIIMEKCFGLNRDISVVYTRSAPAAEASPASLPHEAMIDAELIAAADNSPQRQRQPPCPPTARYLWNLKEIRHHFSVWSLSEKLEAAAA